MQERIMSYYTNEYFIILNPKRHVAWYKFHSSWKNHKTYVENMLGHERTVAGNGIDCRSELAIMQCWTLDVSDKLMKSSFNAEEQNNF